MLFSPMRQFLRNGVMQPNQVVVRKLVNVGLEPGGNAAGLFQLALGVVHVFEAHAASPLIESALPPGTAFWFKKVVISFLFTVLVSADCPSALSDQPARLF